MQTPNFPESNHPLVKSLFHYSDRELLNLFQRYPDEGKYFTAIFCRYYPVVHTLIQHSARSPVQADYLFALTWRHIYHELHELNLREGPLSESGNLTLQNWLINMTAICINQADLPAPESIHYDVQAAPPPFKCYLEMALEQLPYMMRTVVLLAQTFHWSEARIAAYLQAEEADFSPAEVHGFLQEGYKLLEENLPPDIRTIYLDENPRYQTHRV